MNKQLKQARAKDAADKAEKKKLTIHMPKLTTWWNEKYIPIIQNRDRYIIMIGGRGSGKSFAVANMIILRLMTHKFFLGIGIRNAENDLRDSCYKELITAIERMKVSEYFDCTVSPMVIKCKITGNYMIFRGLDDPEKMKSLTDVTFAWYEENVPDTLEQFLTVENSIRTHKADWIQSVISINPTLDGEPTEHWFYKHFNFGEHSGMNFRDEITGEIDGESVTLATTCIGSNYKDNKFLTPEYKLSLESIKDIYTYTVDTLGHFAMRKIEDRLYSSFDTVKNVGEFKYDREKPLYMGMDFNLYPYSAISLWQMDGKKLYQVDEICVNHTEMSSVEAALKEFKKRYKKHYLRITVVGDATGHKDDASKEKGYNNYTIIEDELKGFDILLDVPKTNPSVLARVGFTNKIFLDGNYRGIEFWINKNCTNTKNDFYYTRANQDGTMMKEMAKDKTIKKTYEKYGHLSDASTYLLNRIFYDDFLYWKNGGADLNMTVGRIAPKGEW